MLNFEKHKAEIWRVININKRLPAVVKGKVVPCGDDTCATCELMNTGRWCGLNFMRWAMEEAEDENAPKPEEPVLKPCPFCGGEAGITAVGWRWTIKCDTCYVETELYETPEEAVEAWNRRVE